MAKQSPLDRYVEAGKEFTEASRRRLEAVAQDIMKESGSGRERAEDWAEEMVERGRRAAEQVGGFVRKEIRHQVKEFNHATNQDVIKAVQGFVERTTKAAAPVVDAAMTATKRAAKPAKAPAKASAKKAPAKKAPAAKKATAKKAAAPRRPAAAKAAPAESVAKKATSAKVTAQKKAAPKKAAASKKAQPRAT
jgi:hypothetical protein